MACAMEKGADEENSWARRYKKRENSPRPPFLSSHLQTRPDSASTTALKQHLLQRACSCSSPSSTASIFQPAAHGYFLSPHWLSTQQPLRDLASCQRSLPPFLPFLACRRVTDPIHSIVAIIHTARLPLFSVRLPLQANRPRPQTPITSICKLIA